MAGVEIDADRLADRVAQSEEGAYTVDILVAVQFEAELPYAEASEISDKVPPIRDQHLFPLVAQDLLCLGRPARRHPIGVGIAWPTRAARHHDHPFDPLKTGEGDRLARDLPMPPARLARMQRIAGAVEGADQKAVVAEPDHELFSSRRAVEHSVKRQVRGSRPVAGSKLQSLDAELGGGAKKIIEGQLAKAVGNHADLHRSPLTGPLAPPPHSGVRNRAGHKRAVAPLPDPARPRRLASRYSPPPPGPRAPRQNRCSHRLAL